MSNPAVTQTGEAFDVHGRGVRIGQDHDAVWLDFGFSRLLFGAPEREQFMKAWAEAERRAESHAAQAVT